VTLKYEIEPLKGAVVIGSGEGGEPGEAEVLVTEDSAFDANISADMSCYLRMDDSAAKLYGFNNQSTFAKMHSIVFTKPILKSDVGLAIKANKIYFLGSPSININREDSSDTMPYSLYANYIYFGHDISITNINDTTRFELKPLLAGGTCTVFFDDITLTVSYYDSVNQLHTETKELDGYYQFGGTSNFLYDVLKNYEGVIFQWPDYESMKLTAPAAVAEVNNKFDPYLIRPNFLGLSKIGSGRFEGWSDDNGHIYTNNGNTFNDLLSFLYPTNSESNVSNMVILYANSFNNILDDNPLILKAKQIRLAASMADNPAGFSIPANKYITFETDLFSYYGGNISDQGTNNSLILKSKSGGATVPVYIAQATQIGSYSFPAGYFLLADGINLLDSDSNAVATVSQTEIPASGDTIELTSKSILFEGSLLEFNKKANIIANEPTTVTINADRINFYHEGAGGGNRGDLVLKPSEENPILLYITKDLVVSKSKKGEISTFYVIKAGFYLITQEVSLETLEADPNQTNPVTGVSGIYEGLAMSEPTSYSTPIPPVFSAPGVPVHTGNSSFTPISGAEMGGIYK
ncbi:MAG: hypothetical protein PHR60_06450, partial [Eubacteriales bacterium]|nr:hypothetical protein [Eubacteriales bacterium]